VLDHSNNEGRDCEAILSFVIDAGTPRCRNVSMGRKRPEGGRATIDIRGTAGLGPTAKQRVTA
jgi:hypothetical protein